MSGLEDGLAREILAAVDAGFEKQTEFTSELIRFPSLRGPDHTAQDFLVGEMRARGWAMDR